MRQVFPLVTSLNFDVSPISPCMEHLYAVERFPTYTNFVDTVLQAYQSQYLTRFRLKVGSVDFTTGYIFGCTDDDLCLEDCFPDLKFTCLNAWISFPLNLCGLRELDLCNLVKEPGEGQLPPAIFTCKTLVELKLEVNLGLDQVITMPLYHLPNLKLLHLSTSFISEDGFLPKLVSSCPLLEDLMFEAFMNHVHHTTINSASLKRLRLFMHQLHDCADNSDFVCIHTPNLEFLEYCDNLAFKYSIPIMHCLVKAHVFIAHILQAGEPDDTYHQILTLIRSLSNIQHLYLHGGCLANLERDELKDHLTVFPNLIHLKLGYADLWDGVLWAFLNSSPVLETLVFEQGLISSLMYFGGMGDDERKLVESEQEFFRTAHAVPSSCRYHLKRIVIKEFFGRERELDLIKFLLKHALVLEELVICPNLDEQSVKDIEITLKNLPRNSAICSIQVLRS